MTLQSYFLSVFEQRNCEMLEFDNQNKKVIAIRGGGGGGGKKKKMSAFKILGLELQCNWINAFV